MVLHLDLDSFFVSVERRNNPMLNNLPVAVGGSYESRGVISSASYEARKFGVRSAMPSAKALSLCPSLILIKPSFGLYSLYSDKVRKILEAHCPDTIQASIDEFYMNMSGCSYLFDDLHSFGQHLKKEIKDNLGLPSSIGGGPINIIAKICSKLAKPDGVKIISQHNIKRELAEIDIALMPGIGPKTQETLRTYNVNTIDDIARSKVSFLCSILGKSFLFYHELANGNCNLKNHHEFPAARKQISMERTFHSDISDKNQLTIYLKKMSETLCYKLRNKSLSASNIHVKIRFYDFKTATKSIKIEPTNIDDVIFSNAQNLLSSLLKTRKPVRLLGMGLSSLQENFHQYELDLNDSKLDHNKRKKFLEHTDKIRSKYGISSIQSAKIINQYYKDYFREL